MSTHRPVKVEKNSTLVGYRNRLNLIEGAGTTLTITDDSANDEIDVTINSNSAMLPYDYLIDKSGSDVVAYNSAGTLGFTNADFGDVFNDIMAAIGNDGIVAIRGGLTYPATTTPLITGTGSGLAKNIEVVGVGGGAWPLIDASSGVNCFELQGGVNAKLHKLHLSPHSSGSGLGIKGTYTAGAAYTENSVWWAEFGDLLIDGGTSGTYLFDLAIPEWFKLTGRIYINGNSGVNGMRILGNVGADYYYGESTSDALLMISTNGANTTNLAFEGNSTQSLNLVDWSGRTWLRNDSGSDGTIALKCDYLKYSKIRGIHFENVDIGLQQNTGTQMCTFDFGDSYCTITGSGSNKIFADMNAGYACTVQNMVMWFGGATRVAIDDENDDANAPHKYENITLYGTGGTITADLGTSAQTEVYDSGKWYRKMGTGTTP